MLTLQARVTLIAYVILMVAFFIPLKGDMDLLNKFGTSLIMLLPVSLSVYIINCMVTGSKAKLGLGCNAIAWIESLYILIIAVIVLLYNLMNSKKDTIENFYNTGSCGSNAVYGSAVPYGSCIVTSNTCGSTAGSQAYIQTASGCENRITYQPCNIDCLPNCQYSMAEFGSGCVINNNKCEKLVTMQANGSNCIGSQSYIEYIGCFGSDSDVCNFGSGDASQDYRTRSDLYNSLISYTNQYSNVNPQLIESIISRMTSEQISSLDTSEKLDDFIQSVDDSSSSSSTYDTSKISDIEQIINTAISSVVSSNGDSTSYSSGNNILHNFITAIQDYGTSSDSFSYSAEPVGSDNVKYCINNVDFGNPDCIIVGPGIIQEDTD